MTAIRIETDSIGQMEIPAEADYGIHTARALDNFPITGIKLNHFPELVQSLAMTKKAAALARDGLRFEDGDIATFARDGGYDLIFSNAALHWIPDHPALLARLTAALHGMASWTGIPLALGARQLLTEDLQDGQNLDGLIVVNPFRSPDSEGHSTRLQ